jgi:hypothetical protein
MVADSTNNVWIIAHETTNFDIWYSKCTSGNWISPVCLASTDDLLYPSIGADSNGNVHAVWLNSTTGEIIYTFNSGSWSDQKVLVASGGGAKYFPSIERKMGTASTYSGITFTNSSSKDISFESTEGVGIPEFTRSHQVALICAVMILINIVKIRIRRVRENESC